MQKEINVKFKDFEAGVFFKNEEGFWICVETIGTGFFDKKIVKAYACDKDLKLIPNKEEPLDSNGKQKGIQATFHASDFKKCQLI